MPRKILVKTANGSVPVLTETRADDEIQLQELMKDNPDLLPVEDLGIAGPIMVIGRETTLPSGAVDIVALTQAGDLLVIEFKVGPENQDFRRALAQLLDYGSDIWGMPYEEFERTVPLRYFSSSYCKDERVRGKTSLAEALQAMWPNLSAEQSDQLNNSLSQQLMSGAFIYVLVAQRFTETIKRTINYLNTLSRSTRFCAVEVVRFEGDGLAAFESRIVSSYGSSGKGPSPGVSKNEAQFLSEAGDEEYAKSLKEFFELCRGLGLSFAWGSVGTSIRVKTAERSEPLTMAWLFPPGRVGWMGLTDVSLGFDLTSAASTPSIMHTLNWYSEAIGALPGVEAVKPKFLRAWRFSPQAFKAIQQPLAETLAEFVRRVNEDA